MRCFALALLLAASDAFAPSSSFVSRSAVQSTQQVRTVPGADQLQSFSADC